MYKRLEKVKGKREEGRKGRESRNMEGNEEKRIGEIKKHVMKRERMERRKKKKKGIEGK